MLFHQQERVNLPASALCPALCCVGGRLTFPALPGGSSPERQVKLRGKQRTHRNTVVVFTWKTYIATLS
ncbi:hypothetical protein CesoFtcFv8_014929 [Champsocephalus esox]|uniref:Uncharacterized protein n=1 Tax=Champsocephalus esox TaxID=159716 RepID=A0AAN8BNU0_9TELE|nr:hypothetical protein CesoFtcFv8_014929 [Champsocephalus esox]